MLTLINDEVVEFILKEYNLQATNCTAKILNEKALLDWCRTNALDKNARILYGFIYWNTEDIKAFDNYMSSAYPLTPVGRLAGSASCIGFPSPLDYTNLAKFPLDVNDDSFQKVEALFTGIQIITPLLSTAVMQPLKVPSYQEISGGSPKFQQITYQSYCDTVANFSSNQRYKGLFSFVGYEFSISNSAI